MMENFKITYKMGTNFKIVKYFYLKSFIKNYFQVLALKPEKMELFMWDNLLKEKKKEKEEFNGQIMFHMKENLNKIKFMEMECIILKMEKQLPLFTL